MSGDIDVPWTPKGESVDVKTGSYTIPAGKYAIVAAVVRDGGTFSIDGTVAMASNSPATITAVNTAANPYTVPAGKVFKGSIQSGGGAVTMTVGGILFFTSGLDINGWELGPSTVIDAASGGSGTLAIAGVLYDEDQEDTALAQTFYLPSGTQITGTGDWRASVTIYNEIT